MQLESEPELPSDLRELLGLPAQPFDVILGADVCYSGMAQVPDLFGSSDSDTDTEISASSDHERPAARQAKRSSAKLSWDNSANVAQTLACCMAQPHGVAHLFVHEGRSPDEVAKFTSRAEQLGLRVADRVPLVQRDLTADRLATGTDEVLGPAVASAPACMHDYTTESGLVRLKVCWGTAGK